MATRVYAYCRCSGLGHGTDTWERQHEAIQAFCLAQGYELICCYREDFVPGKLDREDRPAFQQMIADCATTGVPVVVVERLDRLARRYRTQESLITYIASESLALFAADTGENVTEAMLGDPMRRALVQIQGIFAELDKNMTIAKLRKARERIRVANGKCEGRKAYGARDGELATLSEILQRAKWHPDVLAEFLNQQGMLSRYGKPWSAATIWKILNRHENCGKSSAESLQLTI